MKKTTGFLLVFTCLAAAMATASSRAEERPLAERIRAIPYVQPTLNAATQEPEEIKPYEALTGITYESDEHPSVKLHMGYLYGEVGRDLQRKQDYQSTAGHSFAGFVSVAF